MCVTKFQCCLTTWSFERGDEFHDIGKCFHSRFSLPISLFEICDFQYNSRIFPKQQ